MPMGSTSISRLRVFRASSLPSSSGSRRWRRVIRRHEFVVIELGVQTSMSRAMNLEDYERVELGFVPTPIEPLERLGAELGLRLFSKRDDFTGFGGGGNKVRKLEYLMADAVARKAKALITTGGHQSNHARMVAAAARRF